jgi:prophage regulatory protein
MLKVDHPTRMLRLEAVTSLIGLQKSTLYKLEAEGRFPKRRKLTERSSAWREDEVLAWIESRPTAKAVQS